MTVGAVTADTPKQGSHVLSGSIRIALIVGMQAALGSIFWFEAARLAKSSSIGTAAALYTSLQFVNYATGMGVAVTLARYGGIKGREQDAWFGWSVVYTCISSLLGTLIYLAAVHSSSTDILRQGPQGYFWFFLLTAGMSLGPLVDVRLVASRSWGWLLIKNLLIGVVRLPLALLHPIGDEAVWLFGLIAAPQAILGVAGVVALPKIMGGRMRLRVPEEWRKAWRFSFVNWVAVLATNAPAFVVPLIVALSVKPAVNAAFFLACSIAIAVFLAPTAISTVVLVEGAKDQADFFDTDEFRKRCKHALLLAVGLSVAALVGSAALAPLITIIYGKAFHLTAVILPVMLAACVPWSVAAIRLSEARLRHDHVTTVAITFTIGVGIVGLTALLVPSMGPWGAVYGWVAGNVAAAVVAETLGRLRWRRRRPAHRARPARSLTKA